MVEKQVCDDDLKFIAACDAFDAGLYEQAFTLHKELAESGDKRVLMRLGWLYETGSGVPEDPQSAVECYRNSCDDDEPEACYCAARVLRRQNDFVAALPFFEKASRYGNASASYWAYTIYRGKDGVPGNLEKAAFYRDLAVERGHVFAQRDVIKQAMRSSRTPWAYAMAATRFVLLLTRGAFMFARNDEDLRLR